MTDKEKLLQEIKETSVKLDTLMKRLNKEHPPKFLMEYVLCCDHEVHESPICEDEL